MPSKSKSTTTSSTQPTPSEPSHSNPHDPPPEYSDAPLPAGPSGAAASGSPRNNQITPLNSIPGLATFAVPLEQYTPSNSTLSNDRATLTIEDSQLAKSPARLVSLLRSQAALPPIPEVRICGVGFDVKLNLLRYLVPEETGTAPATTTAAAAAAGSSARKWNYTRLTTEKCPAEAARKANAAPGKVPASGADVSGAARTTGTDDIRLEALAKAFCADIASDKTFILTRTIANWDREYIVGCIRNLLAELGYGGNRLDITFPVAHQRVVITPQPNLLERFMAVFNKPRTYEALEAVWPYASTAPASSDELEIVGRSSQAARVFAVRSERAWWREWQPAIERAILSHRKGIVGLDDLLEVRLGYPGPARPLTGWGKHEY